MQPAEQAENNGCGAHPRISVLINPRVMLKPESSFYNMKDSCQAWWRGRKIYVCIKVMNWAVRQNTFKYVSVSWISEEYRLRCCDSSMCCLHWSSTGNILINDSMWGWVSRRRAHSEYSETFPAFSLRVRWEDWNQSLICPLMTESGWNSQPGSVKR